MSATSTLEMAKSAILQPSEFDQSGEGLEVHGLEIEGHEEILHARMKKLYRVDFNHSTE